VKGTSYTLRWLVIQIVMSIQLRVYMQNILIHKQIEMFANTLKSGEMFPYNP